MWFGGQSNIGDVEILQERLNRVGEFKYLGEYLHGDGGLEREVNHRIQLGWKNWKTVSLSWQ